MTRNTIKIFHIVKIDNTGHRYKKKTDNKKDNIAKYIPHAQKENRKKRRK